MTHRPPLWQLARQINNEDREKARRKTRRSGRNPRPRRLPAQPRKEKP